jgi:TRAP-type uncharacterized transport system substrate-binding protein
MKSKNSKFVFIGLLIFLMMVLFFTTPGESAPDAKKIYRTEVRTTGFGGICYVMGFATADILNKKSSWVRCAPLESTGATENIKTVGRDIKKRQRTFLTSAFNMYDRAHKGESPMNDKPELYKEVMPIRATEKIAIAMYTFDPSIKTVKDLKGKTVGTWGKGTVKWFDTLAYIAYPDVIESIKFEHGGYQTYNAMVMGKVDVVISFAVEISRHKYTPVPKLAELISKGKKLYIVSRTPESLKETEKHYGEAYKPCPLKADAIGPGLPEKSGSIGYFMTIGYLAYPELSNDVVYEILKTTTENWKMYKDYHPSGDAWAPENMGLYPVPKENWHPGARKFFEENGINYGLDYFNDVFSVN